MAAEKSEILPMAMMEVVNSNSKHNCGGGRRVARRISMVGAAESIQCFGLWLKRYGNHSILRQ